MRDPKDIFACPLNGKACVDGVREDFPDIHAPNGGGVLGKLKCRWWQHLVGKDPQSEKQIDNWDCAIAWLPVTTIETAQMTRQGTASVDKVANEVAQVRTRVSDLTRAIQSAGENIRSGIETGTLQILLPGPPTNGEGDPPPS